MISMDAVRCGFCGFLTAKPAATRQTRAALIAGAFLLCSAAYCFRQSLVFEYSALDFETKAITDRDVAALHYFDTLVADINHRIAHHWSAAGVFTLVPAALLFLIPPMLLLVRRKAIARLRGLGGDRIVGSKHWIGCNRPDGLE
jgi:hypothetical protein